ncbi:MAG: ABC transporter ATP-binding protein [Granulosicoccus sp.]
MSADQKAVLEVDKLSKSFGGVKAISNFSFQLYEGEILGLIGPNGSGKSTTVNVLAGIYPATSGDLHLDGKSLQKMPDHERVRQGLARTFQTTKTFPDFTVREQITLGCHTTLRSHPIASVLGSKRNSSEQARTDLHVQRVLEISRLSHLADNKVVTISSAEQRFLMIATALASGPKVLLLDEPAAGLVSHERDTLCQMIKSIRDNGISVLVIEHHMALIMEVCDRIAVLNFGSMIAEGTPADIRNNQAVIDAYLGEAA